MANRSTMGIPITQAHPELPAGTRYYYVEIPFFSRRRPDGSREAVVYKCQGMVSPEAQAFYEAQYRDCGFSMRRHLRAPDPNAPYAILSFDRYMGDRIYADGSLYGEGGA